MVQTQVVPIQSEPRHSIFFNRPSFEYTGFGNTPCFCGYSGRWFYSSEEAVRRACKEVEEMFNGDEIEGPQMVNYNDLYLKWNIETTSFGAASKWDPSSRDSRRPNFVFSWCGPGTQLYDKCGESVFLVEPAYDALPEYYCLED